jgi:hypothetical protein
MTKLTESKPRMIFAAGTPGVFAAPVKLSDILKGNPAEGACAQSRPRARALLSVPLVSQGGRAMDAYFTSSSA